MNENFTNRDILIQYLDGELEGDQLISIKEKITADKNLSAELESLRLTRAAVKTYGLKKSIASVHTEMMKELNHQTATPVIRMKKILQYGLRIAAVLILIAGSTLMYQYFTATPGKLFNNNFEAYQLSEVRGNANNNLLETAYKNGRLKEVIALFKQLPDPHPQDYFLQANAALRLHDAAAAIASFEKLQQINKTNNTNFYEEDTEYFLGLAYLDNNQPAMALLFFEKIRADKGHPYHNKISAWFMQKVRRLVK
jgi:tetratricopeptide (TPR) repeat protein